MAWLMFSDPNLYPVCKLFSIANSQRLISMPVVSRAEAEVIASYVVANMENSHSDNSSSDPKMIHTCLHCTKEFRVPFFLKKHMNECHPPAVSAGQYKLWPYARNVIVCPTEFEGFVCYLLQDLQVMIRKKSPKHQKVEVSPKCQTTVTVLVQYAAKHYPLP